MKENNSSSMKKEPKSIATRISHKIQKTLGVSNTDIVFEPRDNLIKPSSDNRLIRSTKMIDLFAAEETPYVHKDEGEADSKKSDSEDEKSEEKEAKTCDTEDDDKPCKKEEEEKEEKTCDKKEYDKVKDDSKEEDEKSCGKVEDDRKVEDDNCQEICFREVQIVKITGCVGPTGPPGPLLPFSNTFICLNRETEQLLSKEDPIIWTSNTIKLGDINNVVNASGIYIWRPGYYMVYYNLCHKQPCQFSLFKNGTVINGSTTGSLQNSSFIIVRIDSADFISPSPTGLAAKLEVVNHTSTVQNNQQVAVTGGATISVILLFETST
jgi:hypothetical protein